MLSKKFPGKMYAPIFFFFSVFSISMKEQSFSPQFKLHKVGDFRKEIPLYECSLKLIPNLFLNGIRIDMKMSTMYSYYILLFESFILHKVRHLGGKHSHT